MANAVKGVRDGRIGFQRAADTFSVPMAAPKSCRRRNLIDLGMFSRKNKKMNSWNIACSWRKKQSTKTEEIIP
jgi:hypothetical protein